MKQLRDFYEVWGHFAKVRQGKAKSSKKSTMFSCLGHSGKFAGHCQNEWERKDPWKTQFYLVKQRKTRFWLGAYNSLSLSLSIRVGGNLVFHPYKQLVSSSLYKGCKS